MKQFTVVLTEENLKNIATLLSRCNMTGAEVPAYVGIVNALNAAKEIFAAVEAEGAKAAPAAP
jgi:hypothetical protein